MSAAVVLLFGLLLSGAARAQVFWQPEALLADMFPQADHFEPVVVQVSDEEARGLRKRLGAPLPGRSYTFQAAHADGELLGYVLFDEQIGQHDPITFAVQLSPGGTVLRHEVVVYRERYGEGVIDPRFRRQFIGKSATDPIVAGRDIDVVSGATYSSRAMAIGVKRATVLAGLLPNAGDASASAGPGPAR